MTTARNEQITFLAAAVAYYAFVSLIPLSLLGLVIASVMGGAVFEGQIMETASEFLTPDAQELLVDALAGESGRSGATVVGMGVLLWSALRVFRGLDMAFSQVYGTLGDKSFVGSFVNAVVVFVSIVVGVAAMTVVGTAIERLPASDIAPQLGFALLAATLTVAFFPLFYFLPDADLDPGEALPGTLLAAFGWMLLGAGFQLYTANAGNFAAYGVLGAALLLVTWLYFGALIVIVGAVVNAVLADRIEGVPPGGDASVRREGGRETATAARIGRARRSTRPAVGEAERRSGTDRQVQRDGVRHPDISEAMTGEDSRERSDDADERDGAAFGAGPESREGTVDKETDGGPTASERARPGTAPASEVARLNSELADLREELSEFEDRVEDRTVDRDDFESDMKRYVRKRVRRGHARGWGPYLVLLYGTAMTLGAFFFLSGGWSILAMLVVWLSTLGLYVLMVLVGAVLQLLGVPGRVRNTVGSWRS